jgi:hypothetical protein
MTSKPRASTIVSLTQFPDFVVVGPLFRDIIRAEKLDTRGIGEKEGVRFVLDGTIPDGITSCCSWTPIARANTSAPGMRRSASILPDFSGTR